MCVCVLFNCRSHVFDLNLYFSFRFCRVFSLVCLPVSLMMPCRREEQVSIDVLFVIIKLLVFSLCYLHPF